MGSGSRRQRRPRTRYAELDAEREIEAVGASLSLAGPILYAYASSKLSVEQATQIVRSRAGERSNKPMSFTMDKWLAEEGRRPWKWPTPSYLDLFRAILTAPPN
jgi:hypothetical protein